MSTFFHDIPILSILIALPLVGAIGLVLLPKLVPDATDRFARVVALGTSGVTVVLTALAAVAYTNGGGTQFTESHEWIPSLGVHWALGVDGLGLIMLLLTTVLVPVVVLGGWQEGRSNPFEFLAWVLGMESAAIAVFAAQDVFLFYVVFEATLIPAYFLIGRFGGEGRAKAAVKFLTFQLAGGLIMLASVVGLYAVSNDAAEPGGSASYLISDLAALNIDGTTGRWLFVGFFIAFAIKAPIFPVHTWLADTTGAATPGTSVLLVCVLDKIGTFGMLRFCLGLFPEASQWATPVVVVLALISIVYGAFLAIGETDILRLVGLTSLSHFGFIVLGIFVMNSQGVTGSILYMVNHGLGTAALFLVAGWFIQRGGSQKIADLRGAEKATPVLAGMFLIGGLATLGLPGLSPFVSEFLVLVAAFNYAVWAGAVAVTGIVLAAIYVLWLYQRTMTGAHNPAETNPAMTDASRREIIALTPVVIALVVFGFFPKPLTDIVNPYTKGLLTHVGVVDEPPTVPAHESSEETH